MSDKGGQSDGEHQSSPAATGNPGRSSGLRSRPQSQQAQSTSTQGVSLLNAPELKSSFNSPRPRRRPQSTTMNPITQKVASASHQANEFRKAAQAIIGAIKVGSVVRVRPFLEGEDANSACVQVNQRENTLVMKSPTTGATKPFKVSTVTPIACGQAEFYDTVGDELVDHVVHGLDCCVIATGAANTGKTYTIRGEHAADGAQSGLLPRAIEGIFEKILHRKGYSDVQVGISYLEIYNEVLTDLSNWKKDSRLEILDGLKGQRGIIRGIHVEPVQNTEEAWQYLEQLEAQLREYEREMNKPGMDGYHASAAHRIMTIEVAFTRTETDKDSLLFGQETYVNAGLRFVDLGSSNIVVKIADKTAGHQAGITAREAGSINQSLVTLDRVIGSIVAREKYIPYRDSNLTRLLAQSLGGECKTTFIGFIGPAASSYKENIHTMEFLMRCQEALTYKQLPLWRRDEIIIAGLTERIKALQMYEARLRDELLEKLALKDEEIEFIKQGFAAELDRRKAVCAEEKAALNEEMAAREAANKAEMDALLQAHEAASEEVKTEIESLVAKHVFEIEAQEKKYATDLSQVRAEWDSDLEAAAHELETSDKLHESAITTLQLEHRTALDELLTQQRKDKDALQSAHQKELLTAADDLEALEIKYEKDVASLKKEITKARKDHAAGIEDLQLKHEAEVSKIQEELNHAKSSAEESIVTLKAAHSEEVNLLTREHESTCEELERKKNILEKELKEEIVRLEAEHTERHEAREAQRLSEVNALKEEVARTVALHAEEKAALEKTHTERLSSHLASHAAEKQSKDEEHAKEIAKHQAELDTVKEKHEDIVKLKEKQRVEELAAAEKKRVSEIETLAAEQEAARVAHADTLQKTKEDHERVLAAKKQEHANSIAAVQKELELKVETSRAALASEKEKAAEEVRSAKAESQQLREIHMAEKATTEAAIKVEQAQVADLSSTVTKLQARKDELKRALKVMTEMRDVEKQHKNALREELVRTRQERDGLKADRDECQNTLEANRKIRDRLVQAHTIAEQSLTADAQKLKEEVQQAVTEIDTLHSDIAQRKARAQKNEATADDYRKNVDTKCATLREALSQFRSDNDASNSRSMNDLRAADSLDESDTAANCAELTAIATDATNILSAISDHCRSTNDELSERLNSTSSMAKDFDGDMQKEAENLKSSLTEKLDALQTMVRTAENKIAQWSKAVADDVAARSDALNKFDTIVTANLSQLEAAVTAMSSSQLANLSTLKETLQQSALSHRAQVNTDVEALSASIRDYVTKTLLEFGQSAGDQAFANADRVATELNAACEMVDAQKDEIKVIVSDGRTHMIEYKKSEHDSLMASKLASTQSAFDVSQVVSNIGVSVAGARGTTESSVATFEERTKDFYQQMDSALCSTKAYSNTRTDETLKKLDEASIQLSAKPSTLSVSLSEQESTRKKMRARLSSHLGQTNTATNDKLAVAEDDISLIETSAAVLESSDTFSRDSEDHAPQKGIYSTPDEFAKTPLATEVISGSLKDQWQKEQAILSSQMSSGRGVDFSGELGREDRSGLVSEAQDLSPSAEIEDLLARCTADSDDESQDASPLATPNDKPVSPVSVEDKGVSPIVVAAESTVHPESMDAKPKEQGHSSSAKVVDEPQDSILNSDAATATEHLSSPVENENPLKEQLNVEASAGPAREAAKSPMLKQPSTPTSPNSKSLIDDSDKLQSNSPELAHAGPTSPAAPINEGPAGTVSAFAAPPSQQPSSTDSAPKSTAFNRKSSENSVAEIADVNVKKVPPPVAPRRLTAGFRLARAAAKFPASGEPAEEGDLCFDIGDAITVTARVDEEWLTGTTANGQIGIFPQAFINYID